MHLEKKIAYDGEVSKPEVIVLSVLGDNMKSCQKNKSMRFRSTKKKKIGFFTAASDLPIAKRKKQIFVSSLHSKSSQGHPKTFHKLTEIMPLHACGSAKFPL